MLSPSQHQHLKPTKNPKTPKEYTHQDQPTDSIARERKKFQDFPNRQRYGQVAPSGNGNSWRTGYALTRHMVPTEKYYG